MSQHTLPRVLGALLLYEQTAETRTLVDAPAGTKAGQFVDYPPREGKKLVALSDEKNGKVVVQPYNCVINAALLDMDEARAAASTEGTFAGLQKDGDPHGIMYANAPQDAQATDSASYVPDPVSAHVIDPPPSADDSDRAPDPAPQHQDDGGRATAPNPETEREIDE